MGNRGSYWRLNESLLSDPIHTKVIGNAIKEYFRLNTVDNIFPETLWATHKATIRGELIRIATQVKKERLIDIQRLKKSFVTLKAEHKKHPSKVLTDRLDVIRLELNLALTAKAEKHIRWSGAKYYSQKDKTGPMLDEFFSKLYNSTQAERGPLTNSFLQNLQLPSISKEHKDLMDGAVSAEEIRDVIRVLRLAPLQVWTDFQSPTTRHSAKFWPPIWQNFSILQIQAPH